MFFSLPTSCFIKLSRLLIFLCAPFWVCLMSSQSTAEPCPSELLSFLGFQIIHKCKKAFLKVLARLCKVVMKKHCSSCIDMFDVKEVTKWEIKTEAS